MICWETRGEGTRSVHLGWSGSRTIQINRNEAPSWHERQQSPCCEVATRSARRTPRTLGGRSTRESRRWLGRRERTRAGRSMVVAGGIQLRRRIRSWIWLVPLAGLLDSLVLAVVTLEIDRATGYD